MDRLEPIKVTRQELYEQIWSMPVSRACRIYGLSDVGLAKISRSGTSLGLHAATGRRNNTATQFGRGSSNLSRRETL